MISLNAIKIAASLSGRSSPSNLGRLGLIRRKDPKAMRRREEGLIGSYELTESRESYSNRYQPEAKISSPREDTFDQLVTQKTNGTQYRSIDAVTGVEQTTSRSKGERGYRRGPRHRQPDLASVPGVSSDPKEERGDRKGREYMEQLLASVASQPGKLGGA